MLIPKKKKLHPRILQWQQCCSINYTEVPVQEKPGEKAHKNTCIKFFPCRIVSCRCAIWIQDVTQSRTLSSGAETSSALSSSAVIANISNNRTYYKHHSDRCPNNNRNKEQLHAWAYKLHIIQNQSKKDENLIRSWNLGTTSRLNLWSVL